MNLSFSGCGFLCVYHAGVAAGIREYAPELTLNTISGASAGAIAGAGLVCGVSLGQATSDILKVVIQARSTSLGALSPSFNLLRQVRDGITKTLPENAHEICSGRLRVSLTRFSDGANVIVTNFESKDELIQAIICSCFIPFYCGSVPPTFRGVRYIDGGWSDNQPSLNSDTVTVSPFSGESDICPPDWDSASFFGTEFAGTSIRFTSRNLYRMSVCLFPPHPEVCSKICRQGFEDALRFLAKNGLVNCARCIAVRACITLPDDQPTDESLTDAEKPPSPLYQRTRIASSKITTDSGGGVRTGTRRPRHKHESECESCQETAESVHKNTIPLPSQVLTSLKDAEDTERSLFSYLFSFRLVKLIRYMMLPWTLPFTLTYTTAKSLCHWIPSTKDAQWLVDKSSSAVNFVISEIEAQRHLYSARFTCQLAITEMNYSCPVATDATTNRKYSPTLDFTLADAGELRHAPSTSALSGIEPSGELTEMNFGFTVDLADADSRPVRELSKLRKRDKRTAFVSGNPGAEEYAKVAEQLEWVGLQATHDGHQAEEEFDTFSHVVEYTKRHDAVMAYYYLDDDNRVKVCEIFDVHHSDVPPLPLSRGFSRTVSRRQSILVEDLDEQDLQRANHTCDSDTNTVRPGDVEQLLREKGDLPTAAAAPIAEKRGEGGRAYTNDSGLSLPEDGGTPIPPSSTMHRRDACCSPVREGDYCQRRSTSPTYNKQPSTSGASGGSNKHSSHQMRRVPSSTSVKSMPGALLTHHQQQHQQQQQQQQQQQPSTSHQTNVASGAVLRSRRPTHPPHKRLSAPSSAAGVPRLHHRCDNPLELSDSDADNGEKFFVPERRQRTCSGEYDGDPEYDTEDG